MSYSLPRHLEEDMRPFLFAASEDVGEVLGLLHWMRDFVQIRLKGEGFDVPQWINTCLFG